MKHWYTNGIIQVQKEECPEGFRPGRLPVSEETRRKHSENNAWHHMTQEQKEARAKKLSETLQSRTDEEKRTFAETVSRSRKGKGLGVEPWNKGKKGLQIAWNKGIPHSEKTKAKIKATKQNWSNEYRVSVEAKRRNARRYTDPWNKGISTGPWDEDEKKGILAKQYKTKKKNKSFNSSAAEKAFYLKLLELFPETDVIWQYNTDTRYPFNCDFYVKSLDLFIELNLSWTHGGKLFDNTTNDLQKLNCWKEKALTSNYYKNAIETWTQRDPAKFKAAEENNLNYLVYYSKTDIENFEEDIKRFYI